MLVLVWDTYILFFPTLLFLRPLIQKSCHLEIFLTCSYKKLFTE